MVPCISVPASGQAVDWDWEQAPQIGQVCHQPGFLRCAVLGFALNLQGMQMILYVYIYIL